MPEHDHHGLVGGGSQPDGRIAATLLERIRMKNPGSMQGGSTKAYARRLLGSMSTKGMLTSVMSRWLAVDQAPARGGGA